MDEIINTSTGSENIDPKFLDRLQELGGPKLASELVGMYLTRGAELIESLSSGIDSQDLLAVKSAAHSLISSAGNLGGRQVSELAKKMENAAIEENSEDLPGLLADILVAQSEFQHYLNGALEKL